MAKLMVIGEHLKPDEGFQLVLEGFALNLLATLQKENANPVKVKDAIARLTNQIAYKGKDRTDELRAELIRLVENETDAAATIDGNHRILRERMRGTGH